MEKIELYRLAKNGSVVKLDLGVCLGEFSEIEQAENKINEVCKSTDGYIGHNIISNPTIENDKETIHYIHAKVNLLNDKIDTIDFGLKVEK